jgi:hypothetical protein
MSSSVKLPKERADLTSMSLYTVVKATENEGRSWKEVADVISISASGAGFYLARPCEVGRLVTMILPLPAELRCYDHEKALYKVWGLVQHCFEVSADGRTGYQVGVAFVGKNAPPSYKKDPNTSYRISGMDTDGLWKVTEIKADFKQRRDIRYWTTIELYLALVDGKKDTVGGERTITENLSRSGAAVFTTLDVSVGDRVKFISEKYDFSGLAVVCNRKVEKGKPTRLHLRFVGATFPVKRLKVTAADIH